MKALSATVPVLEGPVRQVWNSPTAMSWGGLGVKLLNPVLLLPAVLTTFSTETVAVWLLFVTLSGMQLLADMGFAPTFMRMIAYGMGGVEASRLRNMRQPTRAANASQPDWNTVRLVVSTMRPVYARLALIFFVLLLLLGTLSLLKPISKTADPASAWFAWAVVLMTSSIALRCSVYSAYLLGTSHVALLRRWEILTSLGGVLTSLLALFTFDSLLSLVIAGQTWVLLQILVNRWLCRRVNDGRFGRMNERTVDREVFHTVWSSAWRSGIAVLMGFGLWHAGGIVYAQIGTAAETATYLVALRLIQVVNSFSQMPFYTKLPQLARLWAQGARQQHMELAKRGMMLSYWTFVAGFIGLGLTAETVLEAIGSDVRFVDPALWSLLGIAIFIERYGAMHLNLYSTTNHIVNHVANGGGGTIYVVVSALLLPHIGMFALPAGLLAGNVGFYGWFSASRSYAAFNLRFWSFEHATMLPALAIVLAYAAWSSL